MEQRVKRIFLKLTNFPFFQKWGNKKENCATALEQLELLGRYASSSRKGKVFGCNILAKFEKEFCFINYALPVAAALSKLCKLAFEKFAHFGISNQCR